MGDELKVVKLELSGFCRGQKYSSQYVSPLGMDMDFVDERIDQFTRAFDRPYEMNLLSN